MAECASAPRRAQSLALTVRSAVQALQNLSVKQTKQLMLHLGLNAATIDDVTESYPRQFQDQKMYLIQQWLDRDIDASWEKLATALRKIGMNVLAAGILETYVSDSRCDEGTESDRCSTQGAVAGPSSSLESANLSAQAVSPEPLGSGSSATLPVQSSAFTEKVMDVKTSVQYLTYAFSGLISAVRSELCEKESQEPTFLDVFRDFLLCLPPHGSYWSFLRESEDDFLVAGSIRKLIAILCRHSNYSNYEVFFHIIRRFCSVPLQEKMRSYLESFERFEMNTTVDVYLNAISAEPSGPLHQGFTQMALKIGKPSSQCSLHEIRKVKELIAERASLQSYSVYIEGPVAG